MYILEPNCELFLYKASITNNFCAVFLQQQSQYTPDLYSRIYTLKYKFKRIGRLKLSLAMLNMIITFSWLNRRCDQDEVYNEETLILKERHMLLFTSILDIHAAELRLKACYLIIRYYISEFIHSSSYVMVYSGFSLR